MASYDGDNLTEWTQHFQFSEDFHAYLLQLGVQDLNDLSYIYEDVQSLAELQSNSTNEEYYKFLSAKNLTSQLRSLDLPPVALSSSIHPPSRPPAAPPAVARNPLPAATTTLPPSIDVKILTNTTDRWADALNIYQQESSDARNQRTSGSIVINALIDTSGSMDGTKLIAVKLGLCALVAHLQDNDMMNITIFSDRSRSVTNGFHSIQSLKPLLPQLLHRIRDDGSTIFYDAVIEGVRHVRAFSNQGEQQQQRELQQKAIVIALTDGEDNASKHTSPMVFYRLSNPGINHFMFILVAIDMKPNEEELFRSWMDLRHCKQISVNIHTGTKLVQIFREVLVHRVLLTDVNHSRFYQILPSGSSNEATEESVRTDRNVRLQNSGDSVQSVNTNAMVINFDEEDQELLQMFGQSTTSSSSFAVRGNPVATGTFQILRQDLLRQHNQATANNMNEDEDSDRFNYSPAVSRCNSVSDVHMSGNRMRSASADSVDYDSSDDPAPYLSQRYYRSISPTYRPTSPAYQPTSPTYTRVIVSSPVYYPSSPVIQSISPAYTPTLHDGTRLRLPPSPNFSRLEGYSDNQANMDEIETIETNSTSSDFHPPHQIRRISNSPASTLRTDSYGNPVNVGGMYGRSIIVDEIDNQGRLFNGPGKADSMANGQPNIDHLNLPKECYCPITHQVMIDPVVCSDGHTYERAAIERWLQQHYTSPVTNLRLPNLKLIPNYSLKNLIDVLKSTAVKNSTLTNSSSSTTEK